MILTKSVSLRLTKKIINRAYVSLIFFNSYKLIRNLIFKFYSFEPLNKVFIDNYWKKLKCKNVLNS